MTYGYATCSWVLVAERAAVFRPHVGAKSVLQELEADSSGAWRLGVARTGSAPCSTAADSLTVESGMQGFVGGSKPIDPRILYFRIEPGAPLQDLRGRRESQGIQGM